jgi:hypothetical protein
MTDFGSPVLYGLRWQRWGGADTCAEPGRVLICAYHIDVDERPSLWMEVASPAEAEYVCEHFELARGEHSVDFCVAYDADGRQLCNGGFGAE